MIKLTLWAVFEKWSVTKNAKNADEEQPKNALNGAVIYPSCQFMHSLPPHPL